MIRVPDMIRLVAVTSILTIAIGAGAAMAKPSEPIRVAAAETTVAADSTEKVSEPVTEASAGCARKVKVVYAGYGEAARVGCAVAPTR